MHSSDLVEFFGRDENDENERSVGDSSTTLASLRSIIITTIIIAVCAVPATLGRATATVAVPVVVVVATVRVVDGITRRRLVVAVAPVV